MTTYEKVQFVKDLSDRIRDTIIQDINSGKVLQEWDGIELRLLLRDRHQQSADMCRDVVRSKRGRNYKNHCLCAGL